MNIMISNASTKPIYEQIVSQIKDLIIKGSLVCGDPLPSMRLLAKELRISIITTKRAYEELELAGFIETVAGKGSKNQAKPDFKKWVKGKALAGRWGSAPRS